MGASFCICGGGERSEPRPYIQRLARRPQSGGRLRGGRRQSGGGGQGRFKKSMGGSAPATYKFKTCPKASERWTVKRGGRLREDLKKRGGGKLGRRFRTVGRLSMGK